MMAAKGNEDAAKSLFKKAAQSNSEIAKINLAILNNEVALENKEHNKLPLSIIQVDGISVASYLDDPLVDANTHQQIANKLSFFQSNPKGGTSKVFLNMNESNNFWTAFVCTKDGYTGDDGKGIKISDTLEKLLDVHGAPNGIYETTQGQIYSYPTRIFYLFNNKIYKWMTYGGVIGY